MSVSKNNKLDLLGIGVAFGCVLHCVALPLLSGTVNVFAFWGFHNVWIDLVLLVTSFCLGFKILIPSYRKKHKQILPIVLFCLGIAMLVLRDLIFSTNNYLFTSAALLFLILSHSFNLFFSSRWQKNYAE